MTKSQFRKMLLRYIRGTYTNDEKSKVDRWFDRMEGEAEFTLTEEDKALTESKLLNDINNRINRNGKKKKTTFTRRLNSLVIYGSIAASFTLAVFLARISSQAMEGALSANKPTAKIYLLNRDVVS